MEQVSRLKIGPNVDSCHLPPLPRGRRLLLLIRDPGVKRLAARYFVLFKRSNCEVLTSASIPTGNINSTAFWNQSLGPSDL